MFLHLVFGFLNIPVPGYYFFSPFSIYNHHARHTSLNLSLSSVITPFTKRKHVDLPTSIAVGLSVQAVPKSMQHLPGLIEMLAISELLPVALLAVVMNMFLPQDDDSN